MIFQFICGQVIGLGQKKFATINVFFGLKFTMIAHFFGGQIIGLGQKKARHQS